MAEKPIEEIRADLIGVLTQRMENAERLPVGVTGAKSVQKYIDSLSDSHARDWHSVICNTQNNSGPPEGRNYGLDLSRA